MIGGGGDELRKQFSLFGLRKYGNASVMVREQEIIVVAGVIRHDSVSHTLTLLERPVQVD